MGKVNHQLCKEILNVWRESVVVQGFTVEEGINVLNQHFKGRHMTVPDVQHLYGITPDTRYFECGIITHIKIDG